MTASSRPLRVLQIHPLLKGEGIDPEAGGKSRLSLQLSRELARQGHDVRLYPFPEPILDKVFVLANGSAPISILPPMRIPAMRRIPGEGLQALRLPRMDRSIHGLVVSLLMLDALRQAMADFRPDVVHCHNSFSEFALLYRFSGCRPPLILTHHTHMPGENLDLFDRIQFASEALRRLVCGTDGRRLEKTVLIHPAVESMFSELTAAVDGARRGILFVGGLRPDKGLQFLLAAYAESPALRKIPLRICGEGPERENYLRMVEAHRIPATFLGRASSAQVRDEMLRAKMLVNPSPGEGFSLALAESMCCGAPVLGWKPQVEEMQSFLGMNAGIPFHPLEASPADLADAVLRGLARKDWQSAAYRAKLSRKARAYFSIGRYVDENLALYRSLLS